MNYTEQPINRNESKVLLKQYYSDLDTDQICETLRKSKTIESKRSNREKDKKSLKNK